MATYKVTYTMDGVPTHMIDGRVVTQAEFDRILPSKPIEAPLLAHAPGAWPMMSEAMGVQPDQIAEAVANDAKLGVPTEYTRDGRPILRDRKHRQQFLKAHHMRDNHGGYGD